ncbi:MAG: T9SS type A sorting domain-containing protein [Bacteroidia bacterium]|nr:T9SS type A sorting domain-containing protein [Bacteroidia bacterium]
MKKLSLAVITLFISCHLFSQCHYVPSTSSLTDSVTWSFTGGSFQSYGCAPIDPTRWLSGGGMSVTMTFTNPEDYPMIRVWGMNDDDVVSVTVNGSPYTMNYSTATYLPKVVCGLSPGPDGVYFIGGNIVGSNTNAQGNYSYSDVMLLTTGVNTITVTGIAGAGWGFAGVSVNCSEITGMNSGTQPEPFHIFPIPVSNQLNVISTFGENFQLEISNAYGQLVLSEKRTSQDHTQIDVSDLPDGIYIVVLRTGSHAFSKPFLISR